MKKKYKYPIKGLPEASKPKWDERYCFFPRTSCPFCGKNNIVYGAYTQKTNDGIDAGIRVRYLCASCGHSDNVKRVEFIPAPADTSAKEERNKRQEIFRNGGTWEDVIIDAMEREV